MRDLLIYIYNPWDNRGTRHVIHPIAQIEALKELDFEYLEYIQCYTRPEPIYIYIVGEVFSS